MKPPFLLISVSLFVIIFNSSTKSYSQNRAILLESASQTAFERLKNNQLECGAWKEEYNGDTIPTDLHDDLDVYTGLLISDLIAPLSGMFNVGPLIANAMKYVSQQVNHKTGLLKFYLKNKRLPADADDTGLFWMQAKVDDSALVRSVIDTLLRYQAENGLFQVWFKKNGISDLPQVGKNPNPIDLITNIHTYLFLKKYAPQIADGLCESLKKTNIASKAEYWVYNKQCPWLFYIREIDMTKCGCEIKNQAPNSFPPFESQRTYTEMAKLIRDLALKRGGDDTKEKAKTVLMQVADQDFELISKVPLMMHHNDLSAKILPRYWSWDLPYALWLRLYYEYTKSLSIK